VAAILLGLVAWIVGVSRSGFWADDYLDLTHFHASLGNLSDSRINTGKYIINVFWAVGTAVFGRGRSCRSYCSTRWCSPPAS
jgi:hypothetical protein